MATLADVHRYPTIPVIVANCIPIVGVLALGWDLRSIMFVYWFETAVVVFYSALKVVTVGGPITLLGMPAHLTFFGVFMSFHLMMILALEPLPPGSGFFPPEIVRELFRRTWSADVGLVVSHGISFVVNFLGKGEYRRTTVKQEIAAPWKRLLIMHATTFAGAWSVMLFEAPVGALVMLAVLKIVVDLHGHLRARRGSPDAEPARPVPVSGTKLEGVLGLFGAFFVFCGLLLAAGSGGQVYRASRVRTQWSAVDAEVLDCRVNESVDRGRNVSHVVRCRFRYDVDGVEHVTTYWTHSTRDGETAAEMRRWVAQHRSGAVQPIRFDPRAPDRISLGELGETIDPPLVGQTLTAAGGFAGVGALLLVIARWRARRAAGHRPDA